MKEVDVQHAFSVIKDGITAETISTVDKHLQDRAPATIMEPSHEDFKLSAIWPVVRPVLVFVEGMLIFKPAWSRAISALVAGLDAEFNDETATEGPAIPPAAKKRGKTTKAE